MIINLFSSNHSETVMGQTDGHSTFVSISYKTPPLGVAGYKKDNSENPIGKLKMAETIFFCNNYNFLRVVIKS